MELEVPKRLNLRPTLCHGLMGFVVGEAKEFFLFQMLGGHGREMLF